MRRKTPPSPSSPSSTRRRRVGKARGGKGGWEPPAKILSRLARVLVTAAQKLAEDWEQRITKETLELMSHPGARIAAAEAAFSQLQKHFAAAADKLDAAVTQHAAKTTHAQNAATRNTFMEPPS